MASLGDQQISSFGDSAYQRILAQFQGEWVSRLNVDQMFVLIDGVLPFEACLYYQVLPLFLDGSRLHLGTVSPDDTSASEYVRRIISYLNYSLVSHSISSEALRVVLTDYLNYAGSQPASRRRDSFSYGHYRHPSRQQDRDVSPSERLTLIVDSPDDLYSQGEHGQRQHSQNAAPAKTASSPNSNDAIPSQAAKPIPNQLTPDQPNQIEMPAPPMASRKIASQHESQHKPQPTPGQSLAFLNIDAHHLESPIEVLTSLPPLAMLQELLARVLLGGIGRLYFECYPRRIVWSQNGVLQSVLDNLELSSFQGIIQELKVMANASPAPVKQAQQIDIEYVYERSGILLRFRFMPGQHGEEATVQVLRGAALKFHQRQQLGRLEKDAITMAKQLQNKLNEIRAKAYADPDLIETRVESLPKLLDLLKGIEQQLDAFEEK
jgi:type II secretory ATPase GspE/PulE/Tfp pilus assembly ATPase PilB-like protein